MSHHSRYEVVVVRYASTWRPASWRAIPREFAELAVPIRDLSLPLARTWVRAFNRAELAQPYQVWALLRAMPAAPSPPAADGYQRGTNDGSNWRIRPMSKPADVEVD